MVLIASIIGHIESLSQQQSAHKLGVMSRCYFGLGRPGVGQEPTRLERNGKLELDREVCRLCSRARANSGRTRARARVRLIKAHFNSDMLHTGSVLGE
jgi:hypothetical protein